MELVLYLLLQVQRACVVLLHALDCVVFLSHVEAILCKRSDMREVRGKLLCLYVRELAFENAYTLAGELGLRVPLGLLLLLRCDLVRSHSAFVLDDVGSYVERFAKSAVLVCSCFV